jgi:hypothetical protein
METDNAVDSAARVATSAFYSIGQSYISQDDGGIADMVEEKLDFHGKVAGPLMRQVQRDIGTTRLLKGTEQLRDRTVLAVREIEPVCGPTDSFSTDCADLAAGEATYLFISKVYEAFPELGGEGLDHFTNPAFQISKSHLRSEANFRVDAPAARTP